MERHNERGHILAAAAMALASADSTADAVRGTRRRRSGLDGGMPLNWRLMHRNRAAKSDRRRAIEKATKRAQRKAR